MDFKFGTVKPPTPAPIVKKTDSQCVVDGCYELKAPGQTYVCTKHIRDGGWY